MDIPPPLKGLPANHLEYQPRWREQHQIKYERDSTPQRVMNLLSWLDVRDKRVLDLGCNNGYFCFALEDAGAICWGIDYYPQAIHVCNELKIKYHMQSEFHYLNLNTDRYHLYHLLSSFHPDIILCNSIFHHLDDPDSLLEILGIAAKELVIEFQFNKDAEYLSWLSAHLDSRTQFIKRPSNYYARQEQPDITGLERSVYHCIDTHVIRKWIQHHDDDNIYRFELIDNEVRKYHYSGRDNHLIQVTPYYSNYIPLEQILDIHPYSELRDLCVSFLHSLARQGLVHCELDRHLLYLKDTLTLVALDYDDCYNVQTMTFSEYFNTHIRLNQSFGSILNSNHIQWQLKDVLWKDVADLNTFFTRWRVPLLTFQELQNYFNLLLHQSNSSNYSTIKEFIPHD